MRRLIILLTLAFAAVPANAGAQSVDAGRHTARARVLAAAAVERRAYQRNRDAQTEHFTKTVRIGSTGEIDVSNVAGDIVISRGNNSDAVIEVVKTSRASSEKEARELLQLVDVTILERTGRVEIRTRYPRDEWHRRNVNVAVAFNITAPAGASITAKSVSGSVKVTGIKGDVSIESVSGNVTIGDGGRVGQAKSVSGNVQIMDTSLEGALDAGSVSGNVVLRRVKARRLDLGTVSGDVLLEELECDRVSSQSVSGSVHFQGPLAKSGRYELKSHSGEVRVAISGGTGFVLEASSFSGDVRSDFPVTLQGSGGRGHRQRALHGVYGDGSAVLDLTTFSGSIAIVKR